MIAETTGDHLGEPDEQGVERGRIGGVYRERVFMTDRFRIARKDLVLQLATLQARLRKEWPESAEDIRRFISKEIDESRLSLPHLKINRKSLLRFLDDDGIAIDFRGQAERSNDDLSPSQFYVKWAASSLRRSPEPVRQDLTKPTRPLEQTQRK